MLKHIVLRGAILSDMERRELNLIAGGLIQSFGISIDVNEDTFDVIREKNNYFGYANYYLQNSYDDSKMMNKAEIEIFKQLLAIDAQLGTTNTEQLTDCVFHTVRLDLIKVIIINLTKPEGYKCRF